VDDIGRIVEVVCRLASLKQLTADEDIYVAGLSSIQALSLLLELEAAFAVELPDTEFVRARTARQLHEMVLAQRKEAP
jgi:acyl carrier protein